MKTKYKVRFPVAGHEKGAEVWSSDFAAGVNTDALVQSGILTVSEVEPVACPACVEQDNKRPFKATTVEEFREHYADKHAGLMAPEEEDLNG